MTLRLAMAFQCVLQGTNNKAIVFFKLICSAWEAVSAPKEILQCLLQKSKDNVKKKVKHIENKNGGLSLRNTAR